MNMFWVLLKVFTPKIDDHMKECRIFWTVPSKVRHFAVKTINALDTVLGLHTNLTCSVKLLSIFGTEAERTFQYLMTTRGILYAIQSYQRALEVSFRVH